jgi:hypothetical protein
MEIKMTEFMYIGLTVTGLAEKVAEFREAVRGRDENGEETPIDFGRVIPIPREVTDPYASQIIQIEGDQFNYSPSWYERNWGALSNACFIEILEDSDGVYSVQFDTAWDFPDFIFEKMVASFPELVFEGSAFENTEQFYMTFEGRNGQFTWQEGDYNEAFGVEEDDDDDDFYAPMTEAASS